MASGGESAKPLARKLGLKAGMTIRLVDPPTDYRALFEDWPAGVEESDDRRRLKDFIHVFARSGP